MKKGALFGAPFSYRFQIVQFATLLLVTATVLGAIALFTFIFGVALTATTATAAAPSISAGSTGRSVRTRWRATRHVTAVVGATC